MTRPIIGWEQETPISDHVFNDFLSARAGRLYFEEIDLTQLFLEGWLGQEANGPLPSPLELVYLPKIRQKIKQMKQVFAQVGAEIGYAGRFHYVYASKANAAEEIVRTALVTGAHYEMSSRVDVEIVRLMKMTGCLPPTRMVIANGFKPLGAIYAQNLIQLKSSHTNLIPVIDDLTELSPLIESNLPFEVGLRQKSYGQHQTEVEMETANSRFGLNLADLWQAAETIAAAPNLRLKLYHAMVGSQIAGEYEFVTRLKSPIETYARLRQRYPDLTIFNFGGGMPAPLTLNFHFDYHLFVRLLLTTLQETCARYKIPAPDVMGEFGRYTTAEQGAHLFKVTLTKDNGSSWPWYIINGSIMTSFPDSWALGEHFIVLPLNHLDKPFRRVQLGGITCDSDDIYPPRSSRSPLYLPIETKDLYVGFFCIGAYQEMLGGVRGSKHCVLPEAAELIVDQINAGQYQFRLIPGQTCHDVLRNLGYTIPGDL